MLAGVLAGALAGWAGAHHPGSGQGNQSSQEGHTEQVGLDMMPPALSLPLTVPSGSVQAFAPQA
jgi:hypothetical protein